jgi:hypothetical protein
MLISLARGNTSASDFSLPVCAATPDVVPTSAAVTGRILTSAGPTQAARVHLATVNHQISCLLSNADGLFVFETNGLTGEILVIVDPPVGSHGLVSSSRNVPLDGSSSIIDLGDFSLETDHSLLVESKSYEGTKWIRACLLHVDSSAYQCSTSGITSDTSHEFRIAQPGPRDEGELIALGVLYLTDGTREIVTSGGSGLALMLDFTKSGEEESSPEAISPDGCVEGATPNATGIVTSGGEPYANTTVAAFVDELGQVELVQPRFVSTTDDQGRFAICVDVGGGGDLHVHFVAHSKELGPTSTIGDAFSPKIPLVFDNERSRNVCEKCLNLIIEMTTPTLRGTIAGAGELVVLWEDRLRVDDDGNFAVTYPIPEGSLRFLVAAPADPPQRHFNGPHPGVPLIAAFKVDIAELPIVDGVRTLTAALPAANFRLGFVAPSGDRVVEGQSGWSRVAMLSLGSLTCPPGGYGYSSDDVIPVHNVILGAAAYVPNGTYNVFAQGDWLDNFSECAGVTFSDGAVTETTPNLSFSDGIWWMQIGEDTPADDPPPSNDSGSGGVPAGGGGGAPAAIGEPVTAVVPRPASSSTPVLVGFPVPAGRLELTLSGLTAAAEATVTVTEASEASGVTLLPTAFEIDVAASGRLSQTEIFVPIDTGEADTVGLDPERLSLSHFNPGPVDITTRVTATQVW